MHYFHIITRADWARALEAGTYRPASLAHEGFVHLSEGHQWRGARARFFAGQRDLLLLRIDATKLTALVKYEAADGDAFPHLYGELNLDAVLDVTELEDG